jgi:hypothetical protein
VRARWMIQGSVGLGRFRNAVIWAIHERLKSGAIAAWVITAAIRAEILALPLLELLELLPIFPLSLLLTFGIVSGSDLQACNLRALTGPPWPQHRVSAGSRLVNYKSLCFNA